MIRRVWRSVTGDAPRRQVRGVGWGADLLLNAWSSPWLLVQQGTTTPLCSAPLFLQTLQGPAGGSGGQRAKSKREGSVGADASNTTPAAAAQLPPSPAPGDQPAAAPIPTPPGLTGEGPDGASCQGAPLVEGEGGGGSQVAGLQPSSEVAGLPPCEGGKRAARTRKRPAWAADFYQD